MIYLQRPYKQVQGSEPQHDEGWSPKLRRQFEARLQTAAAEYADQVAVKLGLRILSKKGVAIQGPSEMLSILIASVDLE